MQRGLLPGGGSHAKRRRPGLSAWIEGLTLATGVFITLQMALGAILPGFGASVAADGVSFQKPVPEETTRPSLVTGLRPAVSAPIDRESIGSSSLLATNAGDAQRGLFDDVDLSPYGLSPYYSNGLDVASNFSGLLGENEASGADEARRNYKDGDMRISIPLIKYDAPVYGGTDEKRLNKGPGLFEISPLPGLGDRNVSIAGHRNGVKNGKITRIMFYDLDKLDKGDYIYLYDRSNVYRYRFESAEVVEDDDWSPVASKGYSCVTLVTCTPIGVADHRLIVRGALEGVYQPTDGRKPEGKSLPASATLQPLS